MNEKKTFLCRNYRDGVWHEHQVQVTDAEIDKMIPAEDRATKHLKVGEGYVNPKAERVIIRLS